jgi:hypothetical protein
MRLGGLKKYALGAGGMLALVVAIVLATGSGSAVAAQITSVFVTNTASHPVPVNATNTDANGNIKVHEQGTATVQGAVAPAAPAHPVVLIGGLPPNPGSSETIQLVDDSNGIPSSRRRSRWAASRSRPMEAVAQRSTSRFEPQTVPATGSAASRTST